MVTLSLMCVDQHNIIDWLHTNLTPPHMRWGHKRHHHFLALTENVQRFLLSTILVGLALITSSLLIVTPHPLYSLTQNDIRTFLSQTLLLISFAIDINITYRILSIAKNPQKKTRHRDEL